MPYYVHRKGKVLTGSTVGFATAQAAHKEAKRLGPVYVVTFDASDDERTRWHIREGRRFASGEYVQTPWTHIDEYPDHYAHLSIARPGMVAYTPDDESGYRDRQIVTKPGRYLARFYAEKLSADEIARLVAAVSADAVTLHITRDPDEIERVYTRGPRSCMSRLAYRYQGHCHPSRVYGGEHSDLAVAYTGTPDAGKVTARALVWPDQRRAGRVYPSSSCTLAHLLRRAGYNVAGDAYERVFKGARIAAIEDEHGNGWIMPYVDGHARAGLAADGHSFILLSFRPSHPRTTIDCQQTQSSNGEVIARGVTAGTACPDCEHNDYAGDGLCYSCAEWFVRCSDCDRLLHARRDSEAYIQTPGGDILCDRHYELSWCAMCDDDWIDQALYTDDEIDRRREHGISDLCADCAGSHVPCIECVDEYVAHGETCECGWRAPAARCPETFDLPLADEATDATDATEEATC